jgi:cellulose synthase/poly-beta-1,6-N-acetylglucosamine synthase-like glycosyltransferase
MVWTVYNVRVIAVGVKHLLKGGRKKREASEASGERLPTFSIIVPVKNEERVVERLLKTLLSLNYPPQKKQIIVVDDGSRDKTAELCAKYAMEHPNQVKLLRKPTSNGKAGALNFGLKRAQGEIVVTFDADNVAELDVLSKAVKYFKDPSISAVQGRVCSINADENMLTKFISYEEAVRYEGYIRGKDTLGLFVDLSGTCQFIRRNVLEEVGGWDEDSLSEDMEMSFRLAHKDHKIKYAPEIRSWEEKPTKVTRLMRQRARWYRGSMEVALRYGRLLRKLDRRRLDAELTAVGPYMLILCLLSYLMTVYTFLVPSDPIFTILAQFTSFFTLLTLFVVGALLVYVTKPRKISNILWLPFVYAYWNVQSFIALLALFQIVLRRPRIWIKTSRTGVVTNRALKRRVGNS